MTLPENGNQKKPEWKTRPSKATHYCADSLKWVYKCPELVDQYSVYDEHTCSWKYFNVAAHTLVEIPLDRLGLIHQRLQIGIFIKLNPDDLVYVIKRRINNLLTVTPVSIFYTEIMEIDLDHCGHLVKSWSAVYAAAHFTPLR